MRRLLLPVIVLALAGCGAGTATPPVPVPTTMVDLPTSYRFAPAAITVQAGATVTWTNRDNFTHNVTIEGEPALTMAPGEAVSYTFATTGLYAYVCSLHPKDMQGSVLVTGA